MNDNERRGEVARRIVDHLVQWVMDHPEEVAARRSRKIDIEEPEITFPWDLTEYEFSRVAIMLRRVSPKPKTGRPATDLRPVLEAIIWYLSMPKARWKDLPKRYPSFKTCHRYFQHWKETRILYKALDTFGIVPQKDF